MNAAENPFVRVGVSLAVLTLAGSVLTACTDDAPDTIIPNGPRPDTSACEYHVIHPESDARKGWLTLGRVSLHIPGEIQQILYDFNAADPAGSALVPKKPKMNASHSYPTFPGRQDTYPIEVQVRLVGKKGLRQCAPGHTFIMGPDGTGNLIRN